MTDMTIPQKIYALVEIYDNDDDGELALATRDLLITGGDEISVLTLININLVGIGNNILELIRKLDPDELSQMRLEHSLCPVHGCDYAICFDDDDPDCIQIRECFPGHDT